MTTTHDDIQVDTEIVITKAMVDSGVFEAREHLLGESLEDLVGKVFIAMLLEGDYILEKAEAERDAAWARVAVLEEALRYYANTIGNPNDGPWGVESRDFGNVAIAALKEGAA